MYAWIVILSLFFVSACTPNRFNYQVEGAQEFVLDSYQIRQGRASILCMEGIALPPLPTEYLKEYVDLIDEDDVLRVALVHPTRTDLMDSVNRVGNTVGYRVVGGAIRLPLIELIAIKGLTLDQARQKIRDLYGKEIANIDIFLEYAERRHSKVELTGAVSLPEIPINGRIRLYEVLALARVRPDANLFKSYVLRGNEILPIDFCKLIKEGDMSQNIVMHPKDKIYIADPLESTVMVLGEVGFAKVLPVPNGFVSLREAIAAAGGIPFTGDKRCIQVIRGNIVSPKIYCLSWNHIAYLPNDSLLLMPGDTVYISERPITKWNRFIEQLLPSSLLIDLGIKTCGVFN